METKRNLKYFTSKGINPVLVAVLIIVALGLILMIVPQTRPFGLVIALVGIGVAVFASGTKSGESEIDNQIEGAIKDIPEQAMIKHEVYERHFNPIIKPVFLKGFDYRAEGVLCKKCPDYKYRTSEYNAAQLYFSREKIVVYGKHFSIVDDSEAVNYEICGAANYEDIKEARIEESTFTLADGRTVPVHSFVLETKSGEKLVDFSVEYGADIDKAAADINHAVEKMTIKAMEKAADKAAKREALRRGEVFKYE